MWPSEALGSLSAPFALQMDWRLAARRSCPSSSFSITVCSGWGLVQMGRCATLHCSVTYRQKDRGMGRERSMKSLMHLDSLKPSLCHCTCRAARGDRSLLATQRSAHFWKMVKRLLASAFIVVEIVLVTSVFVYMAMQFFFNWHHVADMMLITWCHRFFIW